MAIGRIPEPGTGIPESIVDAKGDLVTATAADTPARLAVGTNEHRLVAASGETTGLKYVADTTNYAIAAKGDLLVGTAADTLQALSVGTNGHTLVADSTETTGLKWAAPAGGGKVLQVVTASTSSSVTVTNQTFTDSNLSVSITPSSTNSKVLIIVTQMIRASRAAQSAGGALRLLRDSTAIFSPAPNNFETLYMDMAGTTSVRIDLASPLTYLDSPNTTSATTYKTQGRDYNTNHSFIMQPGGSTSYIIAMEIGA